jgi:hypothetical protein
MSSTISRGNLRVFLETGITREELGWTFSHFKNLINSELYSYHQQSSNTTIAMRAGQRHFVITESSRPEIHSHVLPDAFDLKSALARSNLT